MSLIPATRNKRLAQPEQDHIQWNLTQGHSKRQCSEVFLARHPSRHKVVTTMEIANKFAQFLYNTKEVIITTNQPKRRCTDLGNHV